MRWPNRRPHSLTPAMRKAQLALRDFLPLLDWPRFHRRNVTDELRVIDQEGTSVPRDQVARFACASSDQAIVYLLCRSALDERGMLMRDAPSLALSLELPALVPGLYRSVTWDPVAEGWSSNERSS